MDAEKFRCGEQVATNGQKTELVPNIKREKDTEPLESSSLPEERPYDEPVLRVPKRETGVHSPTNGVSISHQVGPPFAFVCLKNIESNVPENAVTETFPSPAEFLGHDPDTIPTGLTNAEGKKAAAALARTIKQNQKKQERTPKQQAEFAKHLEELATPVKEEVRFHKREGNRWRTCTTYRNVLSIPVSDLPPVGKTPWDKEEDVGDKPRK